MVQRERGRVRATEALQQLIDLARVEATAHVVIGKGAFIGSFEEHSTDASCAILGFELPEEGGEGRWHQQYADVFAKVPTAVLVNSLGGEDLLA